jgi:hypothetical protein
VLKKCVEIINVFREKNQTDKLICVLSEKDDELINSILEEECTICEGVADLCKTKK